MVDQKGNAKMAPLYNPRFEHDNCGIGACVDILGRKTHKIVENALSIVETLKHRAGKDAKGETGDGVGILTQIPHTFFKELNIFALDKAQDYGVAMCFFPMDEQKRNECIAVFEECLIEEDLHLIGWRNVPVDESVLGEVALSSMPYIMQAFVQRPSDVNQGIDFDRRLYVVRRMIEKKWMDAYICSFSSRTIVYKGMFLVNQLRQFYLDLQDESYESAIALVHSRFSTNTNPSWQRAHPNRLIVHNGEINTIHGNRDKMLAREQSLSSSSLKSHLNTVFPSVDDSGSDSAMLDN
ncbi:MAG: glutamate synthase subunit alpha, partial [Erysipelotrichaceae bacterium]